MGFLDKFRSKAEDAVEQHGDKIREGVDKAGNIVDDKTGGKHTDKVQSAEDKINEGIDKLGGGSAGGGTAGGDKA